MKLGFRSGVLLVCACLAGGVRAATADHGIALLVDGGATPALTRLASVLDSGGVKTVSLHAPSSAEWAAALARLRDGARGLPVALLYYRGGYRYADGSLQLSSGEDVQGLVRRLWEGGAGVSVLVLDACPERPLKATAAAEMQSRLDAGLPPGTAVVLTHDPTAACTPGDAYADALTQELQAGALPATDLLEAVKDRSTRDSGGATTPSDHLSMLGDLPLTAAPARNPAAAALDAGAVQQLSDPAAQGDTTALLKLRRLGRAGNVPAERALGNLYMAGLGVARDYTEALHWYSLGAAAGDANSQYLLGVMYENGYGTASDLARAKELYAKAAAQDLIEAKRALVRLQP